MKCGKLTLMHELRFLPRGHRFARANTLGAPPKPPASRFRGSDRQRLKATVVYILLLLVLRCLAIQRNVVDNLHGFTFTPRSKQLTKLTRVQKWHDTGHKLSVIHIAKESSPVVSFGGVGQVVGELTRGQTKKFNTAIILPKYGFITHAESLTDFEYTTGFSRVRGTVYQSTYNDVIHYFVGPPSFLPMLWQSVRIEDVYAQPKFWWYTMKAYSTDLYFTFVAANLITYITDKVQMPVKCPAVVHVHGGSNAPALWFLRQLNAQIPTIYTIHDYHREPFITYPLQSVSRYTHKISIRKQVVRLCDEYNPRFSRSMRLNARNRLDASDFAWCADAVTTVSRGMITELAHANKHYGNLFASFNTQGRAVTIHNWLPYNSWKRARESVSIERPLVDKAKARRSIFKKFQRFLLNTDNNFMNNCTVLWIGRFERNKGVMLLPVLYKAACRMNCSFIIFGHATCPASQRLFNRVLKEAKSTRTCTAFVFKDRASQALSEQAVRSAADVVVIPSYSEAYGLVATEALAYGSIPVVSHVGGLPEVISPFNQPIYASHDSWTGFTFPISQHNKTFSAIAVENTLLLAIRTLGEFSTSSRTKLLQRLIHSTPLAHVPNFDHLEAYNNLVQQLERLHSSVTREDSLDKFPLKRASTKMNEFIV